MGGRKGKIKKRRERRGKRSQREGEKRGEEEGREKRGKRGGEKRGGERGERRRCKGGRGDGALRPVEERRKYISNLFFISTDDMKLTVASNFRRFLRYKFSRVTIFIYSLLLL